MDGPRDMNVVGATTLGVVLKLALQIDRPGDPGHCGSDFSLTLALRPAAANLW